MTFAKPSQQRDLERRPDRVGGAEEADGALGVAGRGGQEGRRLEHDPAEPAIAELDEERQRLLELRRGRLGVTEVGVDRPRRSRAPWRTLRRSPTARRMSRLSSACARAASVSARQDG